MSNNMGFHKQKRGDAVLYEPERPTLKRLVREWGRPPWTIELPSDELIPQEAMDLVDAVVYRGVRFERVDA